MLVSIVIPAFNAEATLGECLEACRSQTYPDTELIVVDDGSADGTGRIAQEHGARCIRQPQAGPAAARNTGYRAASGEIVAFTDSDCVPEPDWIARLLDRFEEGVAGVGGTYGIANRDSLLARMIQEEIRMRHARFGDEVDFLGSFNVAYRKQALEEAAGFDEDFSSASAEDNDLAYRLLDAGWRLRFAPDAVVLHYHPARLGAYLRTQQRHGFWRMKLYAKHPKRARKGDRYAGLADLMAPVMALAFVTLAVLLPFLFLMPGAVAMGLGVAASLLGLLYLGIRLPVPIRMAWAARDIRLVKFADVAFFRDLARGIGMVRGMWVFLVRRKARA